MNWKKFFKPTIGKIVLFLLLMGGINYLIIKTTVIMDARILVGSPFGFWPIGSFFVREGFPEPPVVEFSWLYFILDIIFWYLVSCIVFAIINKLRKK